MSRSSILIIVGFLVALSTFAAIPLAWLRVILPILGLIVVIVGFLMRAERIAELRRNTPQAANHPEPGSPSPHDISPIA
jgi:hypothetical protein